MESLWQDIRFGIRGLLKGRGITTIAILALALGIGANTAIFSVVNALLIRSLPYENPDRLVMLWDVNPQLQVGFDLLPVTAANLADWRDQNSVFEHVAAFAAAYFNLTGAGAPERIGGARVSGDFFQTLGAKPIMGRAFFPEEDQPGRNQVVVISHALWRQQFGSDPNLIGKTTTLDGKGYTVIGIMPQGFHFPRGNEMPHYMEVPTLSHIWTPFGLSNEQKSNRGSHYYMAMARMKPGVRAEQAQAEMSALAANLEKQHPETNTGFGVKLQPLQEQLVGKMRVSLLVLLGAVGFVLLIACANVANLLFARSTARQKEIAIRMALGASRLRIIRQLLTESLLLALAGAVLGILLALWGVDLLLAVGPGDIPRQEEIGIDARVMGFALLLSLATGLTFGLAPALQISRPDLNEALKEGARGAAGSLRRNRVRNALVVSEVALSLVLLIGAGLMMRSFLRLQQVNPGFDPENVITMRISQPGPKFGGSGNHAAFFKQVIERIQALPGVEAAGAVSHLPLSGAEEIDDFIIEGRPPVAIGDPGPMADMRAVSADYFHVMRIPLLRGRYFTEHDDEDARRVAIISDSLARRFWPGEDPIGKRVNRGDADVETDWLTVVGIVADVKHSSLEIESRPHLYFPYLQTPWASMTVVARASADPASLAGALRNEVWAVNKDQPVSDIRPMQDYLAAAVTQRRFNMLLLGLFAALAMTLAAVGIYGVISYSVTQRTREIGIRMAVGAQAGDVFRMVVGQGLALVLTGVTIGLAAAFALTRVMSSLLYEVSATDPVTYTTISLLLTGVAVLASIIPARRAAKVDPMAALRHE
ncbi:MAG TPA: ABC transporter permease [Blastocatellia bacterium]|nr:ABC transporter permease [Blastocatellia bacterium]